MDIAYPAGVRTMPVLRALALPGLLEYSVSLLAISSAEASRKWVPRERHIVCGFKTSLPCRRQKLALESLSTSCPILRGCPVTHGIPDVFAKYEAGNIVCGPSSH